MRRRELLAGAAGLGVLGVGAATVYGDFDVSDRNGEETDTEGDIEPVTLPRIEARGSPPGEEEVPEAGRVTFVELFATWCSICKANMDPMGEAAAQLEDVQFVSVTNEPVGQTVAVESVVEWWDEFDGDWHLAHDADLELTRRLDATEIPHAAVFDEDNALVWESTGYKNTETILDAVEAAE